MVRQWETTATLCPTGWQNFVPSFLCPQEPADPNTPLRKFALSRTLLPQLFAQFDAQSDAELFALLYTQAERAGRGEIKVEIRPAHTTGIAEKRIGMPAMHPIPGFARESPLKMFLCLVVLSFLL